MMPPHFQNQPAFQHIRHHPSASPPIPNGIPFHAQRQHTPQPQMGSRPSSRNAVRRTSSLAVQHGLPQGPPPANGYAYMPQPAIYNPHNGPPIPGHALSQPPQQPPSFQYTGTPQPHSQPHQLQQQAYMDERRQSMPPAFPQHERQASGPISTPPQPQHQQVPHQMTQQPQLPQPIPQQIIQQQSQPQQQEPQQQHQQPQAQMLEPVKRMSVKSRSIFTPIDESRSILSQHWASSTSAADASKNEAVTSNRSQSVDTGSISKSSASAPSPPAPMRVNAHIKNRTTSVSSADVFTPPSRANSAQLNAKRPRLALQIPDEPSDGGSQTADSEEHESTDATGTHPSRRAGTDGSHSSGVVLPPPSPSASALLSAGASGPPNPFARPQPPNHNSQPDRNNNIDTPVSALPSRFMNNEFLPSPSSFYPEWNFRGSDSNTLPSPLNFATPVMPTGPSFLREDSGPSKRKTPESDEAGGDAKRPKHET
jgi:MADS-box transcription factor